MKIITLTLNPAIDVHCTAEHFEAGHENLAIITQKDIGGKGINISRALNISGIDNIAFVALENDGGEDFCRELDVCSVKYVPFYLKGSIRENITIHTSDAGETRLSFRGFCADNSLLEQMERKIEAVLSKNDILTFTGSLPPGICVSAAKGFLKRLRGLGVRIVVDCRSFSIDDILEIKPWLIKPNSEEIELYIGERARDFDGLLDAASGFHKEGIENVMISLGEKGAVLVCREGAFTATPPKIEAFSTIGAGDSSIAGFISAINREQNSPEALKTAVAYGTAACMKEGTQPPSLSDINEIYAGVEIKEIGYVPIRG